MTTENAEIEFENALDSLRHLASALEAEGLPSIARNIRTARNDVTRELIRYEEDAEAEWRDQQLDNASRRASACADFHQATGAPWTPCGLCGQQRRRGA